MKRTNQQNVFSTTAKSSANRTFFLEFSFVFNLILFFSENIYFTNIPFYANVFVVF